MSLEQKINAVRHTLSNVEALLAQAEENLKGCQQTQQTRLEMAKAQIEYRILQNNMEELQNQANAKELTVKQTEQIIKKMMKQTEQLRDDVSKLVQQKVILHRGLRQFGTGMWGLRRQWNIPRQRGRILAVPGAAAAPTPECGCGETDRAINLGTTTFTSRSLCYKSIANGAVLTSATLNLAAAACVVVMAAVVHTSSVQHFQIQRPLGTDQTDQFAEVAFGRVVSCGDAQPELHHYEACESLAAGLYTWSLVNVSGAARNVYAWWIKAREITCA